MKFWQFSDGRDRDTTLLIGGIFLLLIGLVVGAFVTDKMTETLFRDLLGQLENALLMIIGYFFGRGNGASRPDEPDEDASKK